MTEPADEAEPERSRLMRAGLDAFDRGDYFEAHELWEDVWRVVTGPERLWIQGLIQLAAALVKMEKSAYFPCQRLAGRAGDKLRDGPGVLDGVDLDRARQIVILVIAAADQARRLEAHEVCLRS